MQANLENIPTWEYKFEKYEKCIPLERRIVCGRVGHGRLVKDPQLVDEENGCFLYIP